jgi:multiple sugar transport system substrate-binding protein
VIFPLARAGEWIAAGALAPIPESARGNETSGIGWTDVFQGLRERVASRKSQPMVLPLAAPVLVLYYRQDLLQSAGLKPPQTWDEYHELVDKLAAWAPGLNAVEPWDESWRATTFLVRAISGAQHPSQYSLFFDIETGEPLIDNPAFVRALVKVQTTLSRLPRETHTYSPQQCLAELRAGRAALAIVCEPAFLGSLGDKNAATEAESGVDGLQIGAVRLPGEREVYDASRATWEPLADKGVSHVTLTGFSGWGIGATAASSRIQIEAAWNAVGKVSGSDMVSGFPPTLVGLCRESQLQSGVLPATFSRQAPLSAANAVGESLRNTRLVAELAVAGREKFRQALSRGLGTVLDGTQSPEASLQAVATEWRQTIEQIGKSKHCNNYRSSLGLSARPSN